MSPQPSVLILGAGSIGARHARNLIAAGAEVTLADPDPARAGAVEGARAASRDEVDDSQPDAVVIATPTSKHAEDLRWALDRAGHVFVEKPLAVDPHGVRSLVEAESVRIMVGYNLRLHAPLERLVTLVQNGTAGRILSVRLWFGSWLPDWRPHVDYRTTYSARADLGGGVLLDAIHELDELIWLSGDDDFEIVGARLVRSGALEIDVEDTVVALLEHRTGFLADVSLDYLSRRYRRGVEVVGDQRTLRFDWADRRLTIEDASDVVSEDWDVSLDRSYERQAHRLLRFVAGVEAPPVDGITGLRSLLLADRIRTEGRP